MSSRASRRFAPPSAPLHQTASHSSTPHHTRRLRSRTRRRCRRWSLSLRLTSMLLFSHRAWCGASKLGECSRRSAQIGFERSMRSYAHNTEHAAKTSHRDRDHSTPYPRWHATLPPACSQPISMSAAPPALHLLPTFSNRTLGRYNLLTAHWRGAAYRCELYT